MRINTNIASMNAQQLNTNTQKEIGSSLEKLASGHSINKAADDGAGLAISDKLRTQADSLNQGIKNANSGVAMIQMADKAMEEQSNILNTVKTKLIQAADSSTTTDGKSAIKEDIEKLLSQLDNIASQTDYNGKTLLQSSSTSTAATSGLTFQTGEKQGETVSSGGFAANTTNLGKGTGVSGTAQVATTAAFTVFDSKDDSSAVKIGDTTYTINGESTVNGAAIGATATVKQQADALAELINADTANNGMTAEAHASDGTITLTAETKSDTQITVTQGEATDGTTATVTTATAATTAGVDKEVSLQDLKDSGKTLDSDMAKEALSNIDDALTELNEHRSELGSTQNQLESSVRNQQVTIVSLNQAESVIRDTDYAAESANFNKLNIVSQAGMYAISQANSSQQNVMKLLQ
jgi:flagellin